MVKMKVISLLIVLLIPLYSYAYQAEVIRVSDGDTIHVEYKDEELIIRFYGIDAPELDQSGGEAAQQALYQKIYAKKVEIRPLGTDQYKRILALVYLGPENINEWLLSRGLAWVYTGYCKKDFCMDWYQTEKKARQAHLGLWSEKMPQAPWLYRKESKKTPTPKKEQTENPLLASVIIILLALGLLPLLRKGLLKNYIARRMKKGRKK